MSELDETHQVMNAAPFISLFSDTHSEVLMVRADKRAVSGNMNSLAVSGRLWRNT